MTPTVHTEIHSRNLISVHISLIIMPTVHETKIRLLLSFSKRAEHKKHTTNIKHLNNFVYNVHVKKHFILACRVISIWLIEYSKKNFASCTN